MNHRNKDVIKGGFFLLGLLTIPILLLVFATDVNFCATVHGIDHNGNDDPFTIFIGWCDK